MTVCACLCVVQVTIGRKPSEASRYLDDYREVVELLELLASIGIRAPGTTLGSGGGGGMGMRRSSAAIDTRSSFTNLADLA
jgi:hypothetical protein